MGSQQVLVIDIEGVMHRPSGMVFRDIKRREIIEISFDFGSGSNIKTYRSE